jgi:hypothetical protein
MRDLVSTFSSTTANVQRRPVIVKTGFRGGVVDEPSQSDILDRFFRPVRRNVRVIR